jgi:hypothetical protein
MKPLGEDGLYIAKLALLFVAALAIVWTIASIWQASMAIAFLGDLTGSTRVVWFRSVAAPAILDLACAVTGLWLYSRSRSVR